MTDYDLIIIGTGAGGGTLAYALAASGLRILLLERGSYLPQEPENWQPRAVFDSHRYKPAETWYSADGKPFSPGVHYFVGGNTKVYGAALPRLRPASVLDPFCRTHEVANLYIVDSSFFPSSAAMNPALTIAAQALRVADHLLGRPLAATATTATAGAHQEITHG
jgi:choline dehydrogenase-like flavoprotein